jgi:hypothetical protein
MDGTELVEFKMLATMGIPGHFQQQQWSLVSIYLAETQPGMVIKVPKG